MGKKKQKWEQTTNRFIAFFDIMGFKDMVFRNPHYAVLSKLMNLTEMSKIIEDIHSEDDSGDSSGSGSAGEFFYYNKSLVLSTSFSDTIIFVSKDDSLESAGAILESSVIFILSALTNKIPIPVKGALAFGELTVPKNRSIIFGQPLIDAYELQDQLNMYGAILHSSFEKCLYDKKYFNDFNNMAYFKYKVPLKSGRINHYAINWIDFYGDVIEIDHIGELYKEVSGKPRIYVDKIIRDSFRIKRKP